MVWQSIKFVVGEATPKLLLPNHMHSGILSGTILLIGMYGIICTALILVIMGHNNYYELSNPHFPQFHKCITIATKARVSMSTTFFPHNMLRVPMEPDSLVGKYSETSEQQTHWGQDSCPL